VAAEAKGGEERLGVWEIYLRSKKPRDPFWNEWVSRPMAAPFVYLLRHTRVTPNQITFASLFVAIGAALTLLLWRDYFGLVTAALLVQAAFVLDCVDGQLARIRGTSSIVGGYLDFLMDEIKAFTLVAGLGGRLGWQALEGQGRGVALSGPEWLTVGLLGVAVVASGISLTTFMRRPEYLQATGAAPAVAGVHPISAQAQPQAQPRSLVGRLVFAVEWAGKTVLHYPGWFWLPAFLDRIDLFLLPYLGAHVLYLGRAGMTILWRLGP
jgi:hypothetical protein